MNEDDRSRQRGRALAGLAGAMVLVLGVRTLGFEQVLQEAQVVFPPADEQYHLRRAFYSFLRFPDVLLFDVYINHPGGSAISWPPLFDLGLAAVARLLARDAHGFELVAAWLPPALAASTVLPLWLAGRVLGAPSAGLGASCIFAFLPISFFYTSLGSIDHHAAVGAIGAWLLYLCLALVDPQASARQIAMRCAGLALAQAAMLLTWHGSLLYLALVEAILLVAAVATGARALAAAQTVAALATLVFVVPLLAVSPEPLGGAFSAIAVSWLHVVAMGAVAVVAGGLWLGHGRLTSVGARCKWVGGSSGAVLLALALVPMTREGLELALGFLTLSDGAGEFTNEQRALFALPGRDVQQNPVEAWGGFAYLLPLAPLAPWVRARAEPVGSGARAALYVLTGWSGFFAVLAVLQLRYGNDAAPSASLALALGLSMAARAVIRRVPSCPAPERVAHAVAALLFVALVAPAVPTVFLPHAKSSLATLRGEDWPRERAAASIPATAKRFLGEVRQVTPETSGYVDDWRSAVAPEYGVIAHPNLGHAVQYVARRATATDPFWAYIGARNWALTRQFLAARSEESALRAARALDGRYVITMPSREWRTVRWQLHFHDGNAYEGNAGLSHFRLITESAGQGQSLFARHVPDPPDTPAYKLFEIVDGARLVVEAAAGTDVVAAVPLVTPTGRAFEHTVRGRAGLNGTAVLRLAYPTSGVARVRARGPYRVRAAGTSRSVSVPENAVRSGATIRIDMTVTAASG